MKPTYEELEQSLIESERYGRQTDITIDNLEMKLVQMAVENAGLKSKGRELLGEACAVYAKLNKLIDPAIGDFIDGQTLHEFQFLLDCETPTTDAFLAEVRAQGVDMFGQYHNFSEKLFIQKEAQKFAAQLRKGVQS